MKKVLESIMWVFFGIFILGVIVLLVGVGEFDIRIISLGGILLCGGFVLSVFAFVGWDYCEKL